MSKADVRAFLQQNTTRPARGTGTPVPVYQPETIHVVVAGGDAAPMMQAWHMYRPQTVSIDKWR